MKLFGYELKKIPKERIVIIQKHNSGQFEIKLDGNGWLNPIIETFGIEFTEILNKMSSKLTVEEKVEISKLFLPEDITFKII